MQYDNGRRRNVPFIRTISSKRLIIFIILLPIHQLWCFIISKSNFKNLSNCVEWPVNSITVAYLDHTQWVDIGPSVEDRHYFKVTNTLQSHCMVVYSTNWVLSRYRLGFHCLYFLCVKTLVITLFCDTESVMEPRTSVIMKLWCIIESQENFIPLFFKNKCMRCCMTIKKF